jgi:hypothetical protein
VAKPQYPVGEFRCDQFRVTGSARTQEADIDALFLLALFFSPLIAMIGAYPPITAPALTIVGAMMMQNFTKIDGRITPNRSRHS